MKKEIRDGKVAVLYSPGFGAGWSTWASEHSAFMLFDPGLVEAVERKDFTAAAALAKAHSDEIYTGGAEDLQIKWLPEGTVFRVDEYDGSESIVTTEDMVFTA